jgi:hypothetical protein
VIDLRTICDRLKNRTSSNYVDTSGHLATKQHGINLAQSNYQTSQPNIEFEWLLMLLTIATYLRLKFVTDEKFLQTKEIRFFKVNLRNMFQPWTGAN